MAASDPQFQSLKVLSKQFSANLSEVTFSVRRIINNSFPSSLMQFPFKLHPGYYQFGRISFNWQLFMEERSSKVFFGFRRKNKFDNSLKTELSFSLCPVEDPPVSTATENLVYQWSPPPFIELSPPLALVSLVESEPGNNSRDNVLWVSVGNDLMAISFRKRPAQPKSMMYYFVDRNENNMQAIVAKKAPVLWYEKILLAIRPWIEGKSGRPFPINLKHADPQIQEILLTLSENFVLAPKGIEKQQKTMSSQAVGISETLMPNYMLSDYKAKIILRLDVEEKINTESLNLTDDELEMMPKGFADDLELFQLGILLKGIWIKQIPVIRFNIFPPDFMTEGMLFDAFLNSILNEVQKNSNIAIDLDVNQQTLEKALENPSPKTFIFRIGKKGERDTEMFALSIKENSKEHYLMFAADFKVFPAENRVIYKKGLNNLLEKQEDGTLELKRKGILYFIRLLWQVKLWERRIV